MKKLLSPRTIRRRLVKLEAQEKATYYAHRTVTDAIKELRLKCPHDWAFATTHFGKVCTICGRMK